ncbi:TonB-dependent receptor [Candidatus Omnitrophota bacterium]
MRKALFLALGVLIVLGVFGGNIYAADDSNIDLEKIIVTPFRTETSISEITKGVMVISKEEIKSSGATYLPELLKGQSGIAVTDQIANPKGIKLDIRGFGDSSASNILVLIDGRRTNQIDLSGVDWGQIDLNSIERIEIVRGPSTVLYGDNASAGVINIITKKGTSDEPTIAIDTILGSHQFKKMLTSLNVSSKLIDYFLSYSHQESDGYRVNSEYWDNNFFTKAVACPTDVLEIELSTGYHRDHYGLPGALYPNEIEALGRRGTIYPYDEGFTSDYFITTVPKLSFSIGDNDALLSFFNSCRERRSNTLTVYASGASEYETVHYITTYELRPKLEFNCLWGSIDNQLIAGVDYLHAKDNILSGNRINSQQDETDVYKETFGVYLHDNVELQDKFLLNTGGRLEWADYTFDQKGLVAAYESKSIKEKAFELGFGYKHSDASQAYFDYSRSYRLPNTEECYSNKYLWGGTEYGGLNASISHQESNNYELGIRHNYMDYMDLSADIFLMDVKNEIYYDMNTFTNTNYRPKARHYGFELEGSFDLLDARLRPFMSLTLQESFFKGGTYAGKQIPFVPKTQFSIGTEFLPLPIEKLNLTIALDYVGSRYAINDLTNTYPKLKSYTTFSTKMTYTVKNGDLWLSVKNLFNRKYSEYGIIGSQGQAYYPSPERIFRAGVSLKF